MYRFLRNVIDLLASIVLLPLIDLERGNSVFLGELEQIRIQEQEILEGLVLLPPESAEVPFVR